MKPKVLVVDDEDSILQLVDYNLRQAGFAVTLAADGAGALARFAADAPDLIVLDVMLPDMDGFEVCRRIRRASDVPVLFLTARDDERDKVAGLELGDDYLTKPFSPAELVARVRAILRRLGPGDAAGAGAAAGRGGTRAADGGRAVKASQALTAGPVQIDIGRHEVIVAGRTVQLTPREFDLLVALARHAGIVLSRDRLLDLVWGPDHFGDRRVVDVHIKNLRDKLGLALDGAALIETVRGVGYRLNA